MAIGDGRHSSRCSSDCHFLLGQPVSSDFVDGSIADLSGPSMHCSDYTDFSKPVSILIT